MGIHFDHILQIYNLFYSSAYRMRLVTVSELPLSSNIWFTTCVTILCYCFIVRDNNGVECWCDFVPLKFLLTNRAVGSFLEFTHDEAEVVSHICISSSAYVASCLIVQHICYAIDLTMHHFLEKHVSTLWSCSLILITIYCKCIMWIGAANLNFLSSDFCS